jgi:CDP-glucose 4,6-dehydratase
LKKCIGELKPEIVFHLAAQPLVRQSYLEPIETVTANVLGTANVLESCRLSDHVRTVLIVTSDKVYRNLETATPYGENDALGGHDVYSATKACAEIISASYSKSFFEPSAGRTIAMATARAGNVFGGGDWAQDRLIPDLVRAFTAGLQASIRSPNAVRPWQHVLDVTNGYLMLGRALASPHGPVPRSLNFGPSTDPMKVAQISDLFAAAWGVGGSWTFRPEPAAPHEAKLLAVNSTLAQQSLGWRPRLDLPTALAITADWYRLHSEGADQKRMRETSMEKISFFRNGHRSGG